MKHRFMTIEAGGIVDSWELDLWNYFTSLYKNCNKGIKGRGKDRRITNLTGTQPEVNCIETKGAVANRGDDENCNAGTIAEQVTRRIGG